MTVQARTPSTSIPPTFIKREIGWRRSQKLIVPNRKIAPAVCPLGKLFPPGGGGITLGGGGRNQKPHIPKKKNAPAVCPLGKLFPTSSGEITLGRGRSKTVFKNSPRNPPITTIAVPCTASAHRRW